MCFLTQSYFDTPKMIRKNVNYVIIKKIGNPMDLKRILKEWSLGVTVQELQEIYDNYMSGGDMTRFFMIDLEPINPSLDFVGISDDAGHKAFSFVSYVRGLLVNHERPSYFTNQHF